MDKEFITIGGAREHNLKGISLKLPRNQLIVITGLSGSGKSSLAFDTLYAEGQRKYVESLSAYARQFLDQMQKPDVDFIEGLSPAISIEQRTAGSNPRSTIATTTEIYDYLRLLFANVGKPHCHKCAQPITHQTVQQIVDQLFSLPAGSNLLLLAPLVRGKKGEHRDAIEKIRREGFVRARVDGRIIELEDEKVRLKKNFKHDIEIVVDRLALDAKTNRARLTDSVETALKWGEGSLLVAREARGEWSDTLLSTKNACVQCGISYGTFTPRHFSFNSPYGACSECHGLGSKLVLDPDLIVPDPAKSIEDGAIAAWRRGGRRLILYYKMVLRSIAKHYDVSIETPWKDLSKKTQDAILYGSDGEEVEFGFWRGGAWRKISKPFEGVIPNLQRLYENSESEFTKDRLVGYMTRADCGSCKGARLKPESLAVTVGDTSANRDAEKSIMDVCSLSVRAAHEFFSTVQLTAQQEKVAHEILKEILARLSFMKNVGLDYLTLDRESGTLSGGEAQRVRLATQIGTGLVGVLYILDEPSIGLHQRDNSRLLNTLEGLRDLGNTVIVVEHDEETIRRADHIVDLGPGAGVHGGRIVAEGTLEDVLRSTTSLTAKYLRHDIEIPIPKRRTPPRKLNGWLKILGARENNLKNIQINIPLGCLVCVTGVSGSGKSTLVDDILRKALFRKFYSSKERPGAFEKITGDDELDKVIVIDQSPIGRTPRSNPATYTGMFTHIRDLFARLPLSKVRGFSPGRYSFNVKGGRCEACQGDGILRIEMHFLPDVYVTCETCGGKRYNRDTLEVTYKGKNIADVLDLSVDEALPFFRNIPQIAGKIETLADVGLGYVRLGQQATTLSGGEAQRVKLSTELAKRATGRTLYILDEPTTGLHFADIDRLLQVLHRLRDSGNTVLVIEHNLDVIKTADWIIDLGPEGGDAGGRVVATGTPEQIARVAESHTGKFLQSILPCLPQTSSEKSLASLA